MKIVYHVPLASLGTLCTPPHLIFTTYEITDSIFMYRWGNWSSERLSDLSKITQLVKYQSWDSNPHILASQCKSKGSKVWSRSWRTDKISLNEEKTEGGKYVQNQKFLTSAKVEKYDWRVVVNNNETSETSEQETEKSKWHFRKMPLTIIC